MEFRVPGPLAVTHDHWEVEISAGRHRALLAALLLRADQVVSTEELTGRIWDAGGGSGPGAAGAGQSENTSGSTWSITSVGVGGAVSRLLIRSAAGSPTRTPTASATARS